MKEIRNKIKFVKELGAVYHKYMRSIESVDYKVFINRAKKWKMEFAVVTFKGGGYCVRNCNGNSLSAVAKEITAMLDGGYYDEVDSYNDFVNDESFELFDPETSEDME